MHHLMIDIETGGKRPNSPILSIGAVEFEPYTGKVGRDFYVAIDPADAFRFAVADGDTFRWWMGQSDAARTAAVGGKTPIADALMQLRKFHTNWSQVQVWANDPDFDCTILSYAFTRVLDADAPWSFWNTRSCRTVAEIAGKRAPKIGAAGTYHNALDDAKHQAKWVSDMLRGIKGADTSSEDDLLI